MAQCLLDISDNKDSKSLLDLQRWNTELAALIATWWMGKPHRSALAVAELMGGPHSPGGAPEKVYEDVLVYFVLQPLLTCLTDCPRELFPAQV